MHIYIPAIAKAIQYNSDRDEVNIKSVARKRRDSRSIDIFIIQQSFKVSEAKNWASISGSASIALSFGTI